MRRLIPLLLAPLMTSVAAQDAEAVRTSTLFTGEYLVQVLGSLALVIALMVGVLWALKRFNGVGSGARMGSNLSVVASVGLGQRERAVLLNAGDKQILVGVAPGHIATLHVFDEPLATAADVTPETVSFADVWRQATSAKHQEDTPS